MGSGYALDVRIVKDIGRTIGLRLDWRRPCYRVEGEIVVKIGCLNPALSTKSCATLGAIDTAEAIGFASKNPVANCIARISTMLWS